MDIYKVYDMLPNGVIVFKNKKVVFLNKHISDVMNITDLSKENAVEIITETLGLDDSKELYSYFNQRIYFKRGKKIIQIAQNNYTDTDVFSFMLVDSSLICSNLQDTKENTEEYIRSNIDAKVANFFKLNKIKKIKILTFFKGLPLKNFAKVLNLTKDFIEIEVDNKHLVSLLETNSILLLNNESKEASVLRGKVVSNNKNIFTIKNFAVSKESMHQREEIRVKPDKELLVQINEKKFRVYDISKKGISLYLNDKDDENILRKTASIKLLLEDNTLSIDTKYLRSNIDDNETKKVILILMPSSNASEKIHNYVTKRQNEIIREIHQHLELKDKVF